MRQRLRQLGPGLLFAGSAVGVSHLVQSTRAGAEFGFTLAPLLILACLLKYPLFRFGAEYSAITGETVVAGYARQGRPMLLLFLAATVVEGVGVIPAVSLVTAGLAMNLFGFQVDDITAAGATVVLVAIVLAVGRYRLLERITRVFVAVFAVLSVVAAVAAALQLGQGQPVAGAFGLNAADVSFAVAVAGWMPIGAGGAAFLSAWIVARSRVQGESVRLDDARFDFDLSYTTTLIVALCFLTMGAALLFSTGTEVSQDSVGFSAQLVSLFAQSVGPWARAVVAVAALAIMVSTVLGSTDGFPRVYAAAASHLAGLEPTPRRMERLYVVFLALQALAALALLFVFFRSFATFIDLVTTVGFFAAPVIAFLNHRIMFAPEIPVAHQPPPWLRRWSLVGIVVLTAVCPLYLYYRFV